MVKVSSYCNATHKAQGIERRTVTGWCRSDSRMMIVLACSALTPFKLLMLYGTPVATGTLSGFVPRALRHSIEHCNVANLYRLDRNQSQLQSQ